MFDPFDRYKKFPSALTAAGAAAVTGINRVYVSVEESIMAMPLFVPTKMLLPTGDATVHEGLLHAALLISVVVLPVAVSRTPTFWNLSCIGTYILESSCDKANAYCVA